MIRAFGDATSSDDGARYGSGSPGRNLIAQVGQEAGDADCPPHPANHR